MKIQERYLWIGGLILVGLLAQQKDKKADNLRTLITTYQLESNIQDAQISDFSQQLSTAKAEEYRQGFEDGRTQAGVAFMHEASMYNYTDGYHAAISQFGIADADGKGLNRETVLNLFERESSASSPEEK